ncbi:MAG TPA: cytochrome c [Lacibacter sp.]|nr:cytochrome c [Lacibacter sp.]HMO89643.1 cytochrome c [Lacibacter sp.]HMP88543.1 cytochrome c [Lacibacter sp.]
MYQLLLTGLVTLGILACSAGGEDPLKAGKKVYDANCLVCHQQDGDGVPRLNASLVESPVVNGNKNTLINVLLLGSEKAGVRSGEYANPMPAQAHLSDADMAHVLTYIRSSFGNKAGPVTPAEVKKLRKK